ncbi:hypothetical protein PUN28_008541 [Cardiocondyla obscurior]|uniref:Uncharacterized protein n=1 Tax=Cardiocondyla obscurior TaxID=286306 RepID=A0AAW2G191_9HYME
MNSFPSEIHSAVIRLTGGRRPRAAVANCTHLSLMFHLLTCQPSHSPTGRRGAVPSATAISPTIRLNSCPIVRSLPSVSLFDVIK